jgi:predicted molibdopterin-dependent oxidoreductase YjgC
MKYDNVLTTCPFCGCGCKYYIQVVDGVAKSVIPCKEDEVSQGKLCIKGWNAVDFVNSKERLTKPLIKENGTFREATWDEAYSLIVSKFKEIRERDGPNVFGCFSSAKTTNEENYLMQKFSRGVLVTNNVDHCARLCHASTVAGLAAAFGSGAMTNSIPEVENVDCFLITGSNTTEQHPLIGSRIFKAKEKGAKIILVDPRSIQLASIADLHLRQQPGTDVAWLNGMMHVIIKEGLADEEFIEQRTENFEEFRQEVMEYTPERVEEITGIPKDDLIAAARMFANAEAASIIYSMGITQHTTGVDNVKSCANLAMLTGNLGKPSTGVNPLRGQNNVQGACDLGALPNVFSGYQAVTVPENREKFEKAWHMSEKIPENIGLTVVEMLNAAHEGKIKCLYVMGENPMISDPDINHDLPRKGRNLHGHRPQGPARAPGNRAHGRLPPRLAHHLAACAAHGFRRVRLRIPQGDPGRDCGAYPHIRRHHLRAPRQGRVPALAVPGSGPPRNGLSPQRQVLARTRPLLCGAIPSSC